MDKNFTTSDVRITRWLALSSPLDEFMERIADVYVRPPRASSADARCVKQRDGHEGITRAILR